jgi:hypothetical protein
MPDLEKEYRDLATADRHIREGEERETHQVDLISELQRAGRSTDDAERLLAALRETLDGWKQHRSQIAQLIDQEESRREDRPAEG